MMVKTIKSLLFFSIISLCLISTGFSFSFKRDSNGNLLRWNEEGMPIKYYIHTDPGIDADKQIAAIVRSFDVWARASSSRISFQYAGKTVRSSQAYDGMNIITWISRGWLYGDDTVAYTTLWVTPDGTILEADIELNGELFEWSTSAEKFKMDIRNVVTHECGHFIGIGHSIASTKVTMFPIILLGEIEKRILKKDDKTALSYLYPLGKITVALFNIAEDAEIPPSGIAQEIVPVLINPTEGEKIIAMTRVDVEPDGIDELAVIREINGKQIFYLYRSAGDEGKPVDWIAYDEWEIPKGNSVIDMTGIDIDGDGVQEIAVLKEDNGDQYTLYIYDTPLPNSMKKEDARPWIAKDSWRIPDGNNLLAIFTLDHNGDGIEEIASIKYNQDGKYYLAISSPPKRGDRTPEDANRKNAPIIISLDDGFSFLDIDSVDIDEDGSSEFVTLNRRNRAYFISVYDILSTGNPAESAVSFVGTEALPLTDAERALSIAGVDIDGSGDEELAVVLTIIE